MADAVGTRHHIGPIVLSAQECEPVSLEASSGGNNMSNAITRRDMLSMAGGSVAIAAGLLQPWPAMADAGIEPNAVKRRGVGLRGHDPERAFQGFTLFAPTAPA